MEDSEALSERMYADIAVVCKKWNVEGISPGIIAARLLQMALAGCEHIGVPLEKVIDKVLMFYGMNQPTTPTVKA